MRQPPPPRLPLLPGRNLRRPLTRRPQVAAAPSAGAERRLKTHGRQCGLRRHLCGPRQGEGSYLQVTQVLKGARTPMPDRRGSGDLLTRDSRGHNLSSWGNGSYGNQTCPFVPSFPMRIRHFSSIHHSCCTSMPPLTQLHSVGGIKGLIPQVCGLGSGQRKARLREPWSGWESFLKVANCTQVTAPSIWVSKEMMLETYLRLWPTQPCDIPDPLISTVWLGSSLTALPPPFAQPPPRLRAPAILSASIALRYGQLKRSLQREALPDTLANRPPSHLITVFFWPLAQAATPSPVDTREVSGHSRDKTDGGGRHPPAGTQTVPQRGCPALSPHLPPPPSQAASLG